MTRAIAAAWILFALVAAAAAIQYPMIPYQGGRGYMIPGPTGPMVPNTPGEAPPVGCNGTADFSDGCAIAVFGH